MLCIFHVLYCFLGLSSLAIPFSGHTYTVVEIGGGKGSSLHRHPRSSSIAPTPALSFCFNFNPRYCSMLYLNFEFQFVPNDLDTESIVFVRAPILSHNEKKTVCRPTRAKTRLRPEKVNGTVQIRTRAYLTTRARQRSLIRLLHDFYHYPCSCLRLASSVCRRQ